ncbi:MAG: cytochrome c biogenesis protein CcsA [Colwellia sp.]
MDFLVINASIACIAYMLATVIILSRLFHPKGPNVKLVLMLACVAMTLHAINNIQLFLGDSNQIIINFTLPNVISLVTLIIAVVVSLAALRYKVNLLLPVVYSFAGIWQLLMIFIPPIEIFPLASEKLLLVSHITLALIAYCILMIATLYAFQVAYINFKLKHKNLTAVAHLPPLMQVEHQLFTILALGTFFLFTSELTGLIFLENFFTKEAAHKTVLSLMALVIYNIILWGHFKQGWRGHRVLMLTISASTLLTLSYFGSRFVKEFLLS